MSEHYREREYDPGQDWETMERHERDLEHERYVQDARDERLARVWEPPARPVRARRKARLLASVERDLTHPENPA